MFQKQLLKASFMHAIVSNGIRCLFLFSAQKSQKFNFAFNPSWLCYISKSSGSIKLQLSKR